MIHQLSFLSIFDMSTAVILEQEMKQMNILCKYISQVATRIRCMHRTDIPLSPDYIKLYEQELLSMSENVEGSLVLLESLLTTEKRRRHTYTREELLRLRQFISPDLSEQTKNSLKQVMERESENNKKPRRDIRTIFVE